MENTIIKIKVKSYRCTTCLKSYSSKIYYDRHISLCSILQKTKKERTLDVEKNQDIPSIDSLYEVIKTLLLEQEKMRKEIDNLKRFVAVKKKQIDVFEYLNKTVQPNQTFTNWVKQLEFTNEDLEVLLDETYYNSMHKYFEKVFGNLDEENKEIPLRAFTEKQNILYIYDFEILNNHKYTHNEDHSENEPEQIQSLKWIKLTDNHWKILVKHITTLLFDKFKEWQDENEERFDDDEGLSIRYHLNVKKIMTNIGEPLTSFQKKIWSIIKLDFKNIVTYEIE
jgi:hypothetical protein